MTAHARVTTDDFFPFSFFKNNNRINLYDFLKIKYK